MKKAAVPRISPRNGETHGLFGLKFLKHHEMRDEEWTADDLIEQYIRVSEIFEKDNEVKRLQRDRREKREELKYKRLRREYKDKVELFKTLIEGDIQRTKNILLNFPQYLKMYYNKTSVEVFDELDCKTFLMRKTLDRYVGERERLIKEYEVELLDVAQFQEMVCYRDIKEFQQERDTKRLFVVLKDIQTRTRVLDQINTTYKQIIDQMLHDSLYYTTVLEVLKADWKEQNILVQQTFNIGSPAIENAQKTKLEVKKLAELSKKEEEKRFMELTRNRQTLKEHPKRVIALVRRDSDFEYERGRYDRENRIVRGKRIKRGELLKTIDQIMTATLCIEISDIERDAHQMLANFHALDQEVLRNDQYRQHLIDQRIISAFVHDLLLDEEPMMYNHGYMQEISNIHSIIDVEKSKQSEVNVVMNARIRTRDTLIYAVDHLLNITRHIYSRIRTTQGIKYPQKGRITTNFMRFFKDIPKPPNFVAEDPTRLINALKSKVVQLYQYYKKKKAQTAVDFSKELETYGYAVVEESQTTFRPRSSSFEDDDDE